MYNHLYQHQHQHQHHTTQANLYKLVRTLHCWHLIYVAFLEMLMFGLNLGQKSISRTRLQRFCCCKREHQSCWSLAFGASVFVVVVVCLFVCLNLFPWKQNNEPTTSLASITQAAYFHKSQTNTSLQLSSTNRLIAIECAPSSVC